MTVPDALKSVPIDKKSLCRVKRAPAGQQPSDDDPTYTAARLTADYECKVYGGTILANGPGFKIPGFDQELPAAWVVVRDDEPSVVWPVPEAQWHEWREA